MHTFLRIIEEVNGLETRSNFPLGNDGYYVKYPRPVQDEKADNEFEKIAESYFSEHDSKERMAVLKSLVGFVFARGLQYPFYKDQNVFIVSENGKTVERIYGKYHKN